MALTVNQGQAAVSGLYTGVTSLYVVAVNPRNADLAAMGYTELGDEPEYAKVDSQGNPYTLVKFYLLAPATDKRQGVLATTTFFLYHTPTPLLINRYGRFGNDSEESIEAMGGHDNVWYAYNGEIDLMKFLEKVLDVRQGQDFFFDKREELFRDGDDAELRAEVQKAIDAKNRVKGCLGIRNGLYQTVFPVIVGLFSTNYKPIWTEMRRQQEWLKEYYGRITFDNYVAKDFYIAEFTGDDEIQLDTVKPLVPTPSALAAAHRPPVATASRPAPSGAAKPGGDPPATTKPQEDENDLPF